MPPARTSQPSWNASKTYSILSISQGQVPSVRVTQAMDGAQMINTVLGVADLAVGIYNAYQGYKIRKEVGLLRQELKLSLDNIQSTLNYQSQQLDYVLAAQTAGNEKLDRLILNVETGFHLLAARGESPNGHQTRLGASGAWLMT
jgi:hypothetical protein